MRLSEGFVRPSHPREIEFSYYQASLLCEMIEQEFGRPALVAMLRGYRDGLDTPAVFSRALRLTPDALEARFTAYLKHKFAAPLAAIDPWEAKGPPGGAFVDALRSAEGMARSGSNAAARTALEQAEAMFPGYVGAGAPALTLAALLEQEGNRRGAADALRRHNLLDETSLQSSADEARLRLALGDTAGAASALERILWITPGDAALHSRLAELSEALGRLPAALRERRAVLAAGASDALEARYQVARVMAKAGDAAGARREILAVLEAAPAFEKAQALLLELGRRP
jgi:tetratricopeptide (TPR) repeat protein